MYNFRKNLTSEITITLNFYQPIEIPFHYCCRLSKSSWSCLRIVTLNTTPMAPVHPSQEGPKLRLCWCSLNAFGVISQKSSLNPRSSRFSPLLIILEFQSLHFIYRTVIHFELIFERCNIYV